MELELVTGNQEGADIIDAVGGKSRFLVGTNAQKKAVDHARDSAKLAAALGGKGGWRSGGFSGGWASPYAFGGGRKGKGKKGAGKGLAARLCFKCGEPGHEIKECPMMKPAGPAKA